MTALCHQYLKTYQGMLSSLHHSRSFDEQYDEEVTAQCGEIRKNLLELFAEAIRVLGDRDSRVFKLKCEELEDAQ